MIISQMLLSKYHHVDYSYYLYSCRVPILCNIPYACLNLPHVHALNRTSVRYSEPPLVLILLVATLRRKVFDCLSLIQVLQSFTWSNFGEDEDRG